MKENHCIYIVSYFNFYKFELIPALYQSDSKDFSFGKIYSWEFLNEKNLSIPNIDAELSFVDGIVGIDAEVQKKETFFVKNKLNISKVLGYKSSGILRESICV